MAMIIVSTDFFIVSLRCPDSIDRSFSFITVLRINRLGPPNVFPLHCYGKWIIPIAIQGSRAITDERLFILKGALDVLILKALSWGPMHGYAVSHWIRSVTDEALALQEGVLYPALHRLEGKGWIDSEWGTSENNRRAKYYFLTNLGRKQLQRELSTWERFANAMGKVVSATKKPVASES